MAAEKRLVFFLQLFLLLFCEETVSQCRQLTACSCILPNGEGYDLSRLPASNPLTASNDTCAFLYSPCANAPLTGNAGSECDKGKGVSLCAVCANRTFNLGTAEETSVAADSSDSKPPRLVLRHGNYESSIGLSCCDPCDTHLLVDSIGSGAKEFRLLLVSPAACRTFLGDRGLSVGSVLLIYFFVLAGIYFVGGALALKLLRGATGWEMVPNHAFWRELPSLVKDGVAFTLNRCRPSTYEII